MKEKTQRSSHSRKRRETSPTTAELEERLKAIETRTDQPSTSYDPRPKTDADRSMMTKWFVCGFVGTLVIILIGVPLYNILANREGVDLLSLKDVLLSVSGYLGGPFGFVIGHYFKTDR